MFKNIFNNIKEFLLELYLILKKPKKLCIWLIMLLPVFVGTIINIILSILWYVIYMVKFFFKYFLRYYKKKNTPCLKIKKPIIITKNYFLTGIKNIFVEYPKRKGFLIMYIQLDLFFSLTYLKKKKKEKNLTLYVKNFLENIILFFFRKLVFLILNVPYIIIKNNNYITKTIYDVLDLKAENWEIYLSNIILNICIKTNYELILKTYKLKIFFKKTKIKFNDKNLDIIKKLVDINLWINGSHKLCNHGIISNMRYLGSDKKFIPSHPSIFLKNNEKEEYLVINQTTKQWLNTIKEDENYKYRTKIELDQTVKSLYKNCNAYIVPPHIIDKRYAEINDSINLINKLKRLKL